MRAQEHERGRWSGTLGFILAAMGSAVGLGNIWRFPYIAGQYGGAVFVLVYLACVLMLGLPLLLAECVIGRSTQRNPVGAFRVFRPHSVWPQVGHLYLVIIFTLFSYYSVVGGWVLHYVFLAFTNSFADQSVEHLNGLFPTLASRPWLQVGWHGLFMLLTVMIVVRGVRNGLERANKIMMPLLVLLLVVIFAQALRTERAWDGIAFFLQPRWQDFSSQAVLEALGQAFFSLSVGMGIMITYGSYLSRETNLVRSAISVAASDTGIALLAGLVIFPLVFSFQLEPAAGPGLIFQTLPLAFRLLPAGQIFAVCFFVALACAALSSAITVLEGGAAYAIDEHSWTRSQAAWRLGGTIFVCGIPVAFRAEIFVLLDTLTTNYLLPLGGLLVAVFTGWILSSQERQAGFFPAEISPRVYCGWVFCLRVTIPLALGLLLLSALG